MLYMHVYYISFFLWNLKSIFVVFLVAVVERINVRTIGYNDKYVHIVTTRKRKRSYKQTYIIE